MKKLLFLGALACGLNYLRNHRALLQPLEPLKPQPYVVVYGRDLCVECRELRQALEERRVPYAYKRLEERSSLSELEPRMAHMGLNTSIYDLPVVDVNARLYVRPTTDQVAARYFVAR